MYPGGEGLTSQGLQYLTDILPDMQLTFFISVFLMLIIEESLL